MRSGAAGAGTGADWANAFTTLAAALTAKAAGDDFWVSEDHAESQASTITLTCPGTAASPCRIICVDHAGTVSPVSADLRTTATITATGDNPIIVNGSFYAYGLLLSAARTSSNAIQLIQNGLSTNQVFDTCKLRAAGNASISGIFQSMSRTSSLLLVNTTLRFANAGATITVYGAFQWKNSSGIEAGGTTPTTLFATTTNIGASPLFQLSGVDLSALGSGKNLFDVSLGVNLTALLTNCKLGSSVSITTGSITAPSGAIVRVINCDSANTNYRYSKQTYQGTITHESTIVRSGGASDGTTTISRKMVSTANSKFYSPLESDPLVIWNETLTALTLTVAVLTDNVTLTTTDAWIEVEYLGTSGFPISTFINCAAANILASGTNQPTDSVSAWNGAPGTPVKQSLAVTFTPAMKGPIRVKVMLARASTTIYFDPLIQVN